MLFTSYEFIGFAALVIFLYYIVPKKFRWVWLLMASYAFYFIANPIYLIYIAVTTISIWFIGTKIDDVSNRQSEYLQAHKEELSKEDKKAYKASMKKKQWHLFLVALLLNIGILAVVKYTNFMINNINSVISWTGSEKVLSLKNIIVPLGISFYTFQAVGYIIDVYRGTAKAERNLFRFALFVSFFPQLVQGPISRFGALSETLYEGHDFDGRTVARGLQRVLWGFFKKMVIADRILTAVNTIIHDTDNYGGAYVFVGMMFYAIELYADFTGGIDITIGIAESMGIKVTENFQRPYFSKSIKEYWNRWHITMGSWFTDYIFYPISVCKPMLKLSKSSRKHLGEALGKRVPIYLSSFIVWFATGVWHGASWNFIVWGLGNFVVIMISQELEPLYRKFHDKFPKAQSSRVYQGFQVIRTVLLMSLLRTFDCYRDVPLTFKMWGNMVTHFNLGFITDGSLLALGLTVFDYVILAAGVLIMFMVSMIQRSGSVRDKIFAKPYAARFVIWFALFILVILLGAYGVGYDASQFIYNQF